MSVRLVSCTLNSTRGDFSQLYVCICLCPHDVETHKYRLRACSIGSSAHHQTAAAKASFAKYAALKALRSQRPEAANGSEKQQYESSLPAAGDSEAVATDDDMRGANGSSASNGSSSNGSSSSNDLHSNHAEEVEDEKVVDVLPKDTL